MKDRIFHWVRLSDVDDWLKCGWVMVPANGPAHHHDYSFLMEWLCDCQMRKPNR